MKKYRTKEKIVTARQLDKSEMVKTYNAPTGALIPKGWYVLTDDEDNVSVMKTDRFEQMFEEVEPNIGEGEL